MQSRQWSNEEIQQDFGAMSSLSEIISELERRAEASGEVVCEVRVNGIFLSEEEELKFAAEKVNEVKTLSVVMKSPEDLAREALISHLDLVMKLSENSVTLSEMLRSGKRHEAFTEMKQYLDACRWVTDALALLKTQFSDSTKVLGLAVQWESCEAEYIRAVREFMDAHERGDEILMADVLEYELSSAFDRWRDVLQPLVNAVMIRA